MASIRRTQSPAHRDRSHEGSFSPLPPSQHRSSSSPSPPPPSQRTSASSFTVGLRQLMTGVVFFLFQRHPRRRRGQLPPPPLSWRTSLPLRRFFLCFLLGFLLGFSPFADLDGMGRQDFSSLEIGSPSFLHLYSHHRNNRNRSSPSNAAAAAATTQKKDLAGTAGVMAVTSGSKTVELEVEEAKGEQVDGDLSDDPLLLSRRRERRLLIVVTPTYNRPLQAFFLSRLGQTLRLVPPPLLWIVVEMAAASAETADLLRGTGVTYRHLVCNKNSMDIKDRGVHQRNAALEHIERHNLDGIVYFADDDNIYSLELFQHIRGIRRFGTWPVAMLAQSKNKVTLEGPVCNGSQIIGWQTNEKSKQLRRFHVDMSGFAFNSTILWDTKRWHRPTTNTIRQLDTVKEGFQETTFIEQIVEDESQMEGVPDGCSKIMNWHLHLEAPDLVYPRGWKFRKNLEVIIPIK